MLRDALKRAKERGVRKIFVVLDFDPSGLCIERVNEREMGVEMVRVALTYEQAKGLPSRPVKRRDTRARKYLAKYGDRCWEVEALEPMQLLQIVEQTLRREVPAEHLREAEVGEEAARVALRLLEPIRAQIEAVAYELLQRGVPLNEVMGRLGKKFAF